MSLSTVLLVAGGALALGGIVGCYRGKRPVPALLVLVAGLALGVVAVRIDPGEESEAFASSCADRGGEIAYDGTVELPVSVPGRRGATTIEYETNYLYRCLVDGITVDHLTSTARISR